MYVSFIILTITMAVDINMFMSKYKYNVNLPSNKASPKSVKTQHRSNPATITFPH